MQNKRGRIDLSCEGFPPAVLSVSAALISTLRLRGDAGARDVIVTVARALSFNPQ